MGSEWLASVQSHPRLVRDIVLDMCIVEKLILPLESHSYIIMDE